MRIRMRTRAAGPRGVFFPGAVVRVPEDVSRETATDWLNAGYAEAVPVHDVDRAVMPAGEQAVMPEGGETQGGETLSLQGIRGIGPAMARKLAAAGIGSAEALARAEVEAVMEAAGVGEKKAAGWIRAAGTLVG